MLGLDRSVVRATTRRRSTWLVWFVVIGADGATACTADPDGMMESADSGDDSNEARPTMTATPGVRHRGVISRTIRCG